MEDENLDQRMQELVQMLSEKQALIKQLIQRCEKQEKKVTKLLTEQGGQQKAKKIPFALFKQFLIEGVGKESKESHICFRIKADSLKNKLPIWVSSNMEIIHSQPSPIKILSTESKPIENGFREIGIQKIESKKQEKYESQLTKDVQQLKQNIGKCQSLIYNLRQLKQLDEIEKEQEEKLFTPTKSELNAKMNTPSELKKTIKQLEGQLFKLTSTNQKLREKVTRLQEAEAHYLSVVQELQEKIGQGSKLNFSSLVKSSLDQSALKKKAKTKKIVMINY